MSLTDTKCLICGAELTVHQRFRGGLCDDWRCHEAVLKHDLEAHRDQAAKALGIEPMGGASGSCLASSCRPTPKRPPAGRSRHRIRRTSRRAGGSER